MHMVSSFYILCIVQLEDKISRKIYNTKESSGGVLVLAEKIFFLVAGTVLCLCLI